MPTGITVAGNDVPAQNTSRNLCSHELHQAQMVLPCGAPLPAT
jgi:hypothetical protein